MVKFRNATDIAMGWASAAESGATERKLDISNSSHELLGRDWLLDNTGLWRVGLIYNVNYAEKNYPVVRRRRRKTSLKIFFI